ncbi:MAG: hypothetical protein ACRD16_09225 [Thermoanaerobaculia bacterium]
MGKTRGWTAFSAAAVILGAVVPARGVILDQVAATVDGRAITESEIRRTILTAGLAPSPPESEMQFRDRVLSEMIDDYLRYRDALRFSPASPDAAVVDSALRKLSERLQAEGKDPDKEFRAAGMSVEEVRASLEKQLVVSQYVRERFSGVAFISREDLQAEYDGPFSAGYRAAGSPVPPLSSVEEDVRAGLRARRTAEEVEKWTKGLREKARIAIYTGIPSFEGRRKFTVPAAPSKES